MRFSSTKWLSTAVLVVLAVFGCLAVPAAAQIGSDLVVQDLDTSGYPQVAFKVSLPESLAGEEVSFEVAENGEPVKDLEVELMEAEKAPPRVVLVVDTSGSMQGGPLDDARKAAKGFIEALGTEADVAIVSFDGEARVAAVFGQGTEALFSALDRLTAGGETALYDGVATAQRLLVNRTAGPRAIVLLSDGGDDSSRTSFDSALTGLRDAGVPVYAIALQSKDYNPRALTTLAEGSGGRIVAVADSGELAGLFEGIAKEISRTYRLSYESARPQTKDVEVDVAVFADDASARSALFYGQPDFGAVGDLDVADVVMPQVSENVGLLVLALMMVFFAVAILAVGILSVLLRQRTGLEQLKYYDQLHERGSVPDIGTATDQVRIKVVSAVGAVAGKRGLTQLMGRKLEQAGLPLRPAEYMTFHLLTVISVGVLAEVLVGNLVLSFGVVLLVALGPVVALDIAVERRRRAFDSQLPDVLSMIAVSLRGGWGLLQAVEFVAQQAGAPAADEFKRVQTEVRLGIPLEQSLDSMASRLQSQEFDAAVAAMSIQREVGGNLAEILDIVGKTVRDRAALHRQVSALTAEGRLSAVILMLLPFFEAMALMVISPGYLQPLFNTLPGVAMSISSLLLLVVGGLWLRRITKIEV